MKFRASCIATVSAAVAAVAAAGAAYLSFRQVQQANEMLSLAREERRPVLAVYLETKSLPDGTTAALDTLTNVGTAPATLLFRDGARSLGAEAVMIHGPRMNQTMILPGEQLPLVTFGASTEERTVASYCMVYESADPSDARRWLAEGQFRIGRDLLDRLRATRERWLDREVLPTVAACKAPYWTKEDLEGTLGEMESLLAPVRESDQNAVQENVE